MSLVIAVVLVNLTLWDKMPGFTLDPTNISDFSIMIVYPFVALQFMHTYDFKVTLLVQTPIYIVGSYMQAWAEIDIQIREFPDSLTDEEAQEILFRYLLRQISIGIAISIVIYFKQLLMCELIIEKYLL